MTTKTFSKFLIVTVSMISLSMANTFAMYDVNLKRGNESKSVTEMQNFLIKNNFLRTKANGYFGPATEQALKAFQKKYKISQTGTFGLMTRTKAKLLDGSTFPPVNSTAGFSAVMKSVLAKDYTVSTWVPYWQATNGSQQVIDNISKIDIVSPFSYEMEETGTIKKPMKLDEGTPFDTMIKTAKANNKLVVPSILWWGDSIQRLAMEKVLADKDLRGSIIFDIKAEIKKYNFDGIDIDFENKTAESRENFTAFLTELSASLHAENKMLICTIESRVTLEDRYKVITPELLAKVEYSNDFVAIGKVCDQVRFMAYDQDNTDIKLNSIRGKLYKPVADIDWVEKVLTVAMRDIEWKKIIVGVATYGNKYEVIRDSYGEVSSYKKIGSMNWFYADAESKEKGITPTRDASGELSYSYMKDDKEYLVWYSDAKAIADKVNLAILYSIGGVAIFKIDGNNDKDIWKIL